MIEVYWHVRKKRWSVRENGRVTRHVASITLKDCTLVVQPGGRDRVRRTGQKHVHAWVRGTPGRRSSPLVGFSRLRYNPHNDEGFHAEGHPIRTAKCVVFQPDGSAWVEPHHLDDLIPDPAWRRQAANFQGAA